MRAVVADITTLNVDAIVNAANTSLLGGGGVDGAIHRAAGPELLVACRMLDGCRAGEAKLTPGFLLAARFVIHTVGPVWRGGNMSEAAVLAGCYRNSLKLAVQHGLCSLAFPCISTGVYNYPFAAAAEIAVQTVRDFVQTVDGIADVVFCCFAATEFAHYEQLLARPPASG